MSGDTYTSIKHRKVYMHTIDGLPAKYVPGQQIVFLSNGMKNIFRSSLEEIRADRYSTMEWRKKRGLNTNISRFGYRMFYV